MQTVRVIEPRVNVKDDEQKNHIVLQGGKRYNQQVYPANAVQLNVKPTNASWAISPPSTKTVVDRLVMSKWYVEVESKTGDFQIGTNDAPRQFPITGMTQNLRVDLNGTTISDNIGDKIHALLAYGNSREDRNKSWSTTCAMPDQYQHLDDWTTYGSAKNPLAEYGENSSECPRGGFVRTVISPTVVRYTITEPLLMSPFYDGLGHQTEGFVNVNDLNINFQFRTDINRFWTHSEAGNVILDADLSVVFYRAPEVIITYIEPDMLQEIPQVLTLPYHKTQDLLESVSNFGIGESRIVTMNSVKLSQVPRRMYLFAQKSRNTKSFVDADAFAGITNVSVLWGNQSGLLGTASQQDLFEMSRRNGLNMSWSQFSFHRGSVICIEFGTQIGLPDGQAPGVVGQFTIQTTLTMENLSGEVLEMDLYQLLMMEGVVQISENNCVATLGNLTPDVVLASQQSDEFDFSHYRDLRGEGFFSSLKSFVNKVARGVQKGVSVAEKLAPIAVGAFPELAPVASLLPAVSRGANVARTLTGGGLSGGGIAGGRLSGGQFMQRQPRRRRRR